MAIIDVVKFDGLKNRDWIIYKHYAEDLSTSTQLIVGEGQVAVFVKGGRICDAFGPGKFKLSTENLPILRSLIKMPFGGRTPFTAEIYYINTTTKLDINWGTSDPVALIDPKYHIRLHIRAFGQIGLKIRDYVLFLQELIGTMNSADVVSYDKTLNFYKGFLINKVKSLIAQIMINNGISALEISAKLTEISDQLAQMLAPDFERFGMSLVNFYIKSINFPDEDFERINAILEDRAAFDIMGDSRYAVKRSFDVYEGAATNENGVAGAFAAGGIGFGAMAAMNNGSAQTGTVLAAAPAVTVVCPTCSRENPEGSKFCNGCGANLAPKKVICPNCQKELEEGSSFCNHCGTKIETPAVCECGAPLKPGSKFCNHCGRKVGE